MNQENISLHELTTKLASSPEAPLKFFFEESAINPGYHVTEVKHAAISSLDCGKGSDQWDEIIIQLLDGSSNSSKGYMPAGKFAGILNASLTSLATDTTPALFFEFAPGNGPMRRLSAKAIEQDADGVSILLDGEQAVCKLFQRWKIPRKSGSGATPSPVKRGCC